MQAAAPPQDLRLVAACCRWPASAARDDAVRSAAEGVDWGKVLAGVRHHRVAGHVRAALKSAGVEPPEDFGRTLAGMAGIALRHALAGVAEEARLLAAMRAIGADVIFLKGSTLAQLAYGSLAIKTSRDIDILIDPGAVQKACRIFADLGYRRLSPAPALTDQALGRYLAAYNEMLWANPATGTAFDAHVALIGHPDLIAGVGLGSARQDVTVAPGVALPTLDRDPLFAFLCAHGGTHHWLRLKWLADVAALVGPDGAEAARLHDAAVALGGGRTPGVALMLCHEFLATPLPDDLISRLNTDSGVRRLIGLARRLLCDNGRDPHVDRRPLNLIRQFRGGFDLKAGFRFKALELRRQLQLPDGEAMDRPFMLRLAWRLAALPPRWIRTALTR